MITIEDIRAARTRCGDSIRLTPAPYSETLSRETGNVLYLKLENMNVTGSFKERGALNRLPLLSGEERARVEGSLAHGRSHPYRLFCLRSKMVSR